MKIRNPVSDWTLSLSKLSKSNFFICLRRCGLGEHRKCTRSMALTRPSVVFEPRLPDAINTEPNG